MAINLNAKYEDMDRVVKSNFAAALANGAYAARSMPILEEVDSKSLSEDYNWMLDTAGFQRLKQNLPVRTAIEKRVTIVNEPWVDNLTVDLRTMKTEQRGKYELTATMMGRKVGRFIDNQVQNLLGASGKAFTENSWDGVPFFSASHPMAAGTTHSNLIAGGDSPWFLFDTSVIKPMILQWLERPYTEPFGPDTEWSKNNREVKWDFHHDMGLGMTLFWFAVASKATLTEEHFQDAMTAAMATPTYELHEGAAQSMGVLPNLLVVGRSNKLAAEKILKATMNDGGGSNVLAGSCELLVLPSLP